MATDLPAGLLGVADMLRNIPPVYMMLGMLLLVGGGVGTWVYLYFFDDYHFAAVREKVLYRDGYKSPRHFNTALTRSQAKSIVTLLDEREMIKEPYNTLGDFIAHSRLKFIHIPVKLGGYPTTDDIQKFLREVENPRRQPMLIHCAQGIRRTGMFVAAFQMSVMGWDKDKTKAEILRFGHSDRTVNDIKKFIDAYDPVKREVTQDLGVGTE
jgi:protein tyrosine/serine phosphatase